MPARLRSGFIIVLTVGITVFILVYFRHHLGQIDLLLTRIGLFGPLVAVILYTVLSLTPIPTDPLTLMMGALYGPFWGLVVSWAGNTGAAMAEYYLAQHLGTVTQFTDLRHKLPWGLSQVPVNSVWFLTLGRMVPGFGSKVVSVVAGLYHVSLDRYLTTTALTNIVGSVLYVIGGHLILRG